MINIVIRTFNISQPIKFIFYLQLQGEGTTSVTKALKYRGLFGTILTVAKEEGPRALYSGLAPGLQRQICFCTVRLGFYDHVRNSYVQLLGGKTTFSMSLDSLHKNQRVHLSLKIWTVMINKCNFW